jgi:Putative transposase
VTIAAHDDMGRERLCHYRARPPFSLAKLRVLKEGNVAYLVKKVGRSRAKRRVMEPVEFLVRLSALIPPESPTQRNGAYDSVMVPSPAQRTSVRRQIGQRGQAYDGTCAICYV